MSWGAVVVPLDGSLVAEAAIPVAAEVARRAGAVLHLVAVRAAEPLVPLAGGFSLPRGEPRQSYLTHAARGAEQLAPACETASLPPGEPLQSFLSYTQEAGADLVVLASHGHGAFGRAWIGRFAQDVLKVLPQPLLVARPGVRPGPAGPFRNIAVLLDGSERAEAVLDPVTRLGALFRARLALLRLWAGDARGAASARDYLEEVALVLRGRGFATATLVLHGRAVAAATAAFAESAGVDLVALATHGYEPRAPESQVSVAAGLLRLGGAPLLSLRAPG